MYKMLKDANIRTFREKDAAGQAYLLDDEQDDRMETSNEQEPLLGKYVLFFLPSE
jgi:hypothetical protein